MPVGYSSAAMGSEIHERFARVSADHRDRIATIGLSENRARTFGELRDDVATMRRALASLGLPPRPTIVLSLGNRVGFVPLFLASLALDAALVLLDADVAGAELAEISARFGADAVIVASEAADGAAVPLPYGLASLLSGRAEAGTWRMPTETGALVLKATSGSTSVPKFVVASEHNLLRDGNHITEGMEIRRADVALAVVPMTHSYGLGNLLMPLLLNGTAIVMRDRFVPGQVAADLVDHRISVLPGVPFIFDCIRRLGEGAAPIAQVGLLVTAGAPIDVETLRYFKQTFGKKIHSLYGTSETGGITYDASDDVSDVVTVGTSLPETTVSLTGIEDAPPGHGRIFVQGPSVAARYAFVDAESDEPTALSSGGFLTADLGRFDHAGQLILAGRVSRVVNIAGRKVHPQEVEQVIAQLSGVLHVTVTAAACPARGEMLVACVRRREPGLTEAAIRAHCAARLSPYKIPRQVVFMDDIPVDARGKTDRRALDAKVMAAIRAT